MGGNDWFPFHFDRLRKSKWWRRASDTAKARNVTMWGEAFKGSPAGSLANDDDELAEAAGYGFDVETFLTHKAEIMTPWVLCSDDRWYHPTVCEVVLEAWERAGERRRQGRVRTQAHRARIRAAATQTPRAPADAARDGDALHGGVSRVTEGSVTRQDALKTDRQDKHSAASAAPLTAIEGGQSKPSEPWGGDDGFLALWDACTAQSRRRSSQRKSWAEWAKLRKAYSAADVLGGYRAYIAEDPDVKRTGGPGVHIWLKDKAEGWIESAAPKATEWTPERWAIAVELFQSDGEWSEALGPPPGKAGCRVPHAVLANAGLGLRLVNGGAA